MSVWMINIGADVTSNSQNPPTSPYALHLDGGNDTLLSQLVDISGQDGALFSYYYERRGPGDSPETGEDIVFEYKNSVGEWAELSRQPGSGPDMTSYEFVELSLPSDALHSSFQLRITSSGSGTGDDWYVDDINVDYAPAITVTPSSFSFVLDEGDSTSSILVVENAGPGTLNYTVENLPVFNKIGTFSQLLDKGLVQPSRPSFPDNFIVPVDWPKGTSLNVTGNEVSRDAGGPDAFGYIWVDSDEPNGPAFDWIDVQGVGTEVPQLVDEGSDDDFAGPFAIGFPFNYYGSVYTSFYISSNGFVGFGPTTSYNSRLNVPLPAESNPDNILAWCWDDLNPSDPTNPGAKVYYHSDGNCLVIQFVDYPTYQADPGAVINAEVIIFANGRVKYQYQTIGAGFDVNSATVGIENFDGTDGMTVVYGSEYLKDNLAVEFTAPSQWLTLTRSEGTVAPGENDTIGLGISAMGLEEGIHYALLEITSNDPDGGDNPWDVPIDLTVNGAPEFDCGDVDATLGVDIDDAVFLMSDEFLQGLHAGTPVDSTEGLKTFVLVYGYISAGIGT